MTGLRKSRRTPIAALIVAAMLAMPAVATAASQRVGTHVVEWPSDASLEAKKPGDTVSVSVRPRSGTRLAVVSLARVARSGRRIAVIATRTLRRGRFTARVPARPGRYRLRVVSGKAFSQVTFTAELPDAIDRCAGDSEADLGLSATEVRAGDAVTVSLTNNGPACVRTGYGFRWQLNANGAWTHVPLDRLVPATVVVLEPGEALSEDFVVPSGTAPGEYRIVKRFDDEDIVETVTVVA